MTDPAAREQAIPDLDCVFELEPHGADVWLGESPSYSWGRIYGGLVVAQALWAATQTVAVEHTVHSLHGYFILGGDPAEPVRYEVDRIRNGRSFTTRRVVARQSSGAIFNLSCSFQRYEEGVETQTAEFPAGASDSPRGAGEPEGSGIERLDVPLPDGAPRSLAWCRFPIELGEDPRLHACALAYLSDTSPMDAVLASHPRGVPSAHHWNEVFMAASLDHVMWFHRPVRADQWLLFDLAGQGIIRTRGLSTGHVFDGAGQHIATIAQEGVIRELDGARS